jgi:hypothetical protein
MVLEPTRFPVFALEGEMQLTFASVNAFGAEGSIPLTVHVPLMVVPVGFVVLNEPPETLEMVTMSPLASPCGVTVVTRQGLLHWRQVV